MHRHSFAEPSGIGYGYGDGRYGGVLRGSGCSGKEMVYVTVGPSPETTYTYQFKADTLDAHPGTLVASLAGLEVRRRQGLPVSNGATHCAAVLSSYGAHV